MIPDSTRNLIARRLAITGSRDDVLRAELRREDRPISVYYFDFGERVLADNFNLGRYVQEQLATDFYRHEGSLQWNYYLYFVLSKAGAEKLWANKRAFEIESDRVFARKFVRDQNELEAEFRAPLAPLVQETTAVPDIAAKWVAELSAVGLEKIADPDAKYTSVVENYLAAQPVPVGVAFPSPVVLPRIPNGTHLRELDPVRFRPHPRRENYRFGRVNLIRGSNGAGKTSLLEAIELAICGGVRRQNGDSPTGARLLVRFDADGVVRACPEQAAQGYRQRDLAWYGAYYRKGNQLCHNFARFNFFDSDAAFQLSAATSDNAVEKAMRALFLGQFATSIEERMRQCLDRFSFAQGQAKQEVTLRREEIGSAKRALAQVKDIKDTREALLQELRAKAASCDWKKVPTQLKIDELAALLESVQDLAEQFGGHGTLVPWIARPSVATLSSDAKKLALVGGQFAALTTISNETSQELTKAREHARALESELKQMKRLVEYHEKPERFELRESTESAVAMRMRIRQLKEAGTEGKGIELTPYLLVTETLGTILKRERAEANKRRKNLAAKKTQIETLEKELSALQSLVAEIKGLGRRFCETHPAATECPLCGTTHANLAVKVRELKAPAPRQEILRTLTAEVRVESEAVTKAEEKVNQLERLRRAADMMGTTDNGEETAMSVVASRVVGIAEALASETAKLEEAQARVNRLKTAGYLESELKRILAELQDSHPVSRLQKAEGARALLKAREDAADYLKTEIKIAEKKLKENQEARTRLIRPILGDASLEDAKKLLGARQAAIDDVLTRVNRAQRAVAVSNADEFSSVERSLTELGNAIARIQEKLERIETKDAIEREQLANITAAEAALKIVEPTLVQTTRAVELLGKLLKSDYEHELLAKALNHQRTKISTIFSRIHSPHEFESVKLDGAVTLRRKAGGDASISEISAGQRAALALSLFLSMNSGVGLKAPWLLFDDPVVHVDDLNTLSFLDLLRDLVMLSDRQVFFATANARIGDLFARKFDCLGEEFVTIALQRENADRA